MMPGMQFDNDEPVGSYVLKPCDMSGWEPRKPVVSTMEEAAFEALQNRWPFSSLETHEVRYWGTDREVIGMMIDQINYAGWGKK